MAFGMQDHRGMRLAEPAGGAGDEQQGDSTVPGARAWLSPMMAPEVNTRPSATSTASWYASSAGAAQGPTVVLRQNR